jgi:hypothetical protein
MEDETMEQLGEKRIIDISELPYKDKIKQDMLARAWEKIGSGILSNYGMNIRAEFEECPCAEGLRDTLKITLRVYFAYPHETVVKAEYVPVALYDIPLLEFIQTKWASTKLYRFLRGNIRR